MPLDAVLSGEWSGDKDPSGEESVTVTKDGELTYSITCSSASSSASAEVVSQPILLIRLADTDKKMAKIFFLTPVQKTFPNAVNAAIFNRKVRRIYLRYWSCVWARFLGDGLISCETSDLTTIQILT